jgi:hypothetical protein
LLSERIEAVKPLDELIKAERWYPLLETIRKAAIPSKIRNIKKNECFQIKRSRAFI